MPLYSDLETLVDNTSTTLDELEALVALLKSQGFINFLAPSSTVSEAGSTHSVQVVLSLLSGTLLNPIIVPINVVGGTASSPGDYTLPANSVTFPVGSGNGATQTIQISISNDVVVENNETIVLQFGTISGLGTLGTLTQHTVTISETLALCDDTNSFEYGTVVSVDVNPVAGTTTYVVNSGVVTGIHTMRWGFYATSAPTGCRIVNYGISPNWENDVYFRVVGEPGSTHHGPTGIGAVNLGENGECFNLFQQNAPFAFQATIVFKHC